MLVLVTAAGAADVPRPWRQFFLGTLAATATLMLVPSIAGGEFQNLALVYGAYCAAFGLLTAGILGVLAARRSA
jgi:hypothetical protein